MAPICSAFRHTISIFFPSSNVEERASRTYLHASKIRVLVASSNGGKLMAQSAASATTITTTTTGTGSSTSGEKTSFGFKNLTETFRVDVQRAEARPLTVELNAPLKIGVVSVEEVENVAIRVELSNGCAGWGEISVLPSVTAVNQAVALAKAREACEFLSCSSPMIFNLVFDEIGGILPGPEFASVRAGVEMALIDAVANSIDVPLWRLFGGVSNSLTTAITFPGVLPVEKASELASKYYQLGFRIFKFQIGKDINTEIKTFQAIQATHPHCSLILDADKSYNPEDAIDILRKLHDSGIKSSVLEQPVHRDDWKGLAEVSDFARRKYGISVAADEICKTSTDVRRIIKENLADVINIKLANFGIMGALEIIELTRESGVELMITNTVETRLATGFAAHLAAGQGCFKYAALDMPFLLAKDPVICGYEASGPVYKLLNARGQGGFLKWDFSS